MRDEPAGRNMRSLCEMYLQKDTSLFVFYRGSLVGISYRKRDHCIKTGTGDTWTVMRKKLEDCQSGPL